jgi:hypothetical protein
MFLGLVIGFAIISVPLILLGWQTWQAAATAILAELGQLSAQRLVGLCRSVGTFQPTAIGGIRATDAIDHCRPRLTPANEGKAAFRV